MNIEQKAIKAVANVAAQAYRKAFDVKPDMTTGALAVMVDAIAALDQPTLAPKIDKEYAIWRAIGSLTQRVRDLEQPTAPEPPKAMIGVSNGKDTIWHDPEVRMVDGIDKCPTCLGTGKVVRLEPVKVEPEASRTENITKPKVSNTTTVYPAPTIQPEASQPLPTEEWEQAFGEAEGSILREAVYSNRENSKKAREVYLYLGILKERLAALWPKAGQVDEVTEAKLVEKWMQKNGWEWPVAGADCSDYDEAVRTVKWFMSHIQAGQVPSMEAISDELCGAYVQPAPSSIAGESKLTREDATRIATSLRHWLSDQLSRMGQPAKPDKFDCDNCDVTDLRPVQPSPVTAEKLAEFIGNWLEPRMQTVWGYSDMAHAILQAFPALGQGRLTREQLIEPIEAALLGYLSDSEWETREIAGTIAKAVVALQPATVSKEQWQKLLNHCHDNHNVSLWAIKAWLKAELGMEVEE